MAYVPPGSRGPQPPLHPLARRLIRMVLLLVAIPVLAYGLFLAAVLIIAAVNGPIRWN
jgi:hypothetical protein